MEALEQTEKERELVALVQGWFRNAKSAKAERKAITDKCYKFYRNEHWTRAQKENKKSPKSQRNYIFSSVEDALSLLTDNKPGLDCWPRSGEDVQIAEKTKQVLDWVWEQVELDKKLSTCLRDYLIAGAGFLKIYFDPDVNYPYGEIAVDVVHPDYIFPDPDATSMENYKVFIHAVPTPLWIIRKQHPKRGHMVKADNSISLDQANNDDTINATTNSETDSVADYAKHHRAWLIECYVRDDATEDYEETTEEELEDGTIQSNTISKTRMKYPQGRKIVVAGDVLLEDTDNPFIDGEPPFVMFENYEQSNSFWPIGDVEYLIEINNDINKIVSRLNDYIRMTAHTIITYDAECKIDPNSLTNIEGVLVKKDKAGEFNVNQPPNFPPAVFDWLSTCKSDLEIISGVREVLMGRNDGNKSGVAINRLQEFALARIRKKARNVDSGVLKVGPKLLSRIKQYYNLPRQIRITGNFPIQEMQPDIMMQPGMEQQQPPTKYRKYDFMEVSNQEYYKPTADGGVEEIQLDVVLEVGMATSSTRARDRQEALDLFDKGIIDGEEVAARFDIGNYKEIQTRMEKKKLEEMQLQMQQQMLMNPQPAPI